MSFLHAEAFSSDGVMYLRLWGTCDDAGGIAVDVKSLSVREREKLTRRFVQAVKVPFLPMRLLSYLQWQVLGFLLSIYMQTFSTTCSNQVSRDFEQPL